MITRIGFGGGCHWCTEAVFQTLKGVEKVEQGWIASLDEDNTFSEAVIVHFNHEEIPLSVLVSIHLYTHSCTSQHRMRDKYRSAVYTYSKKQRLEVESSILQLQFEFVSPIITRVLDFHSFKENEEKYRNYYRKNSNNQFCEHYIHPKLLLLKKKFSRYYDNETL